MTSGTTVVCSHIHMTPLTTAGLATRPRPRQLYSLRKRKAQSGVKPKSVRAITKENMKNLFDRKHDDGMTRILSNTPVAVRQYCIYLFSFLALLRIDEALSLELTNIEYSPQYLVLSL